MKYIFSLFSWVIFGTVVAQEPISLAACYAAAEAYYPNARQSGLIERVDGLQQANTRTNYLPQVALNAQATLQSQVTGLPISLPGIEVPSLNKDQYKITLDATQIIWDGGLTKAQNSAIAATTRADLAKLKVETYGLREQVQQAFFGMALATRQLANVDLLRTDVQAKLARTQAAVTNGTAIKANALTLEAKLLELDQTATDLRARRGAAAAALRTLTGLSIADTDKVDLTTKQSSELNIGVRPELELFEQQKAAIEANNALLDARGKPKVNAFTQIGYGRPGLNFLTNAFEPWAIVGAKATWNLSQFYTKTGDRDHEIISLNAQKVDLQRETFNLMTQTRAEQQLREVGRLTELIGTDAQIISLRERIRTTADAQLDGGIITASDYLTEATAENLARQQLALHEIQLAQANELMHIIMGHK